MTDSPLKKQRGAPKGNQNARKHGYYSNVLDQNEKLYVAQAVGVEGIDEEIAVLRAKLKSVLDNDPKNIPLMLHAAETLTKLLKAKYNLSKADKQGLKEGITSVIREIGLPLGIDLTKTIFK